MNNKFNTKALSIIVIASIFLGFIYNYFSNDGIGLFREELKVEISDSTSTEYSEGYLKGLSLAQTIQLHSQKLAVFIDARDQWEFSEGHIPGAVNIPEFSFDPDNLILASIDFDSLLIIYCDGDDCDTSKRLAKEIINLGYKNVFVFLGGFTEWKNSELQIKKDEIGE
jgi:rhodanese-related sulfurtransferase